MSEITFAEDVESRCEELTRLVEDTKDRLIRLVKEELTTAVKLIANFETACFEEAEKHK